MTGSGLYPYTQDMLDSSNSDPDFMNTIITSDEWKGNGNTTAFFPWKNLKFYINKEEDKWTQKWWNTSTISCMRINQSLNQMINEMLFSLIDSPKGLSRIPYSFNLRMQILLFRLEINAGWHITVKILPDKEVGEWTSKVIDIVRVYCKHVKN